MRLALLTPVMLLMASSVVFGQTTPVAPSAPLVPPPSASPGAVVAPPSLLAPAAPVTPGAQMVTLRYKFTAGQVLKYHMTLNMNMATGMQGQSFNTASTGGGDMIYTVQSVDPSGNATVLIQATAFNMTATMNGQPIAVPQSVADAMKKGFTVVLSPTGKMVSMSGQSSQPGSMDIRQIMNSTGMGGLSLLPDQPVKVGDVWRGSSSLGAMGGQLYTKMALVGLSSTNGHTTATIASKVSMDMAHNLPGAASSMKMDMQSVGHGKTVFDADSGTLDSTTMTMDSDTTTTMPDAAASPSPMGAMKMHMTMDMGMQLEN